MSKKIFITGITGFTGSHMAEFLAKKKLLVGGIARSKKRIKNIENMTSSPPSDGGSSVFSCPVKWRGAKIKGKVKFWVCDLNSIKLKKILTDFSPNFIFHFASSIIRTPAMDSEVLQKNLQTDLFGTLNLLKIASLLPKKPKILVTGSNAEYQIINSKPLKEDSHLYPSTPYGLSKLIQEVAAFSSAKNNNLPLVYTRTFHLIGPKQEPTFVVSDFAKQIAKIELSLQKPQLCIGNTAIKRDFTDVRDAVKAYWLIATKGKVYEVYNVCSQKTYSISQIINFFLSQTKRGIRVIQQKTRLRKGEPREIIGSNKKIKKLGWKSKISLQRSLLDTLNYWRKFLKT